MVLTAYAGGPGGAKAPARGAGGGDRRGAPPPVPPPPLPLAPPRPAGTQPRNQKLETRNSNIYLHIFIDSYR